MKNILRTVLKKNIQIKSEKVIDLVIFHNTFQFFLLWRYGKWQKLK